MKKPPWKGDSPVHGDSFLEKYGFDSFANIARPVAERNASCQFTEINFQGKLWGASVPHT